MTYRRITVFGGSGFLGGEIVLRLADDGAHRRIAVRHPERALFLTDRRARARSPRSAPTSGTRRRSPRRWPAPRPWSTPSATTSSGPGDLRGDPWPGRAACGPRPRRRRASGGWSRSRASAPIRASALPYFAPVALANAWSRSLPGATIFRPSASSARTRLLQPRRPGARRCRPAAVGRRGHERPPVYVGDVADAVARALAHAGHAGPRVRARRTARGTLTGISCG